jgi:hypothetical protein
LPIPVRRHAAKRGRQTNRSLINNLPKLRLPVRNTCHSASWPSRIKNPILESITRRQAMPLRPIPPRRTITHPLIWTCIYQVGPAAHKSRQTADKKAFCQAAKPWSPHLAVLQPCYVAAVCLLGLLCRYFVTDLSSLSYLTVGTEVNVYATRRRPPAICGPNVWFMNLQD